jgi:hypothetical protein
MGDMSIERICSVLGLRSDGWPPDHYTLLGLTSGQVDPVQVEASVLERMERLRPYQLAHPDAVTDAMNRLAQALVCLTDPAARATYDAGLQSTALAQGSFPDLDDESIEPYPLVPDEPPALPMAMEPAHTPARRQGFRDAARRHLYRRLAVTRHLHNAWRSVGQLLAQADRSLRQPVETVEFVAALRDVRRWTDHTAAPPVGHSGQPGALVGAFARRPHVLHAFRDLLRDQRAALAADWQAGRNVLAETLHALQAQLRRSTQDRLRRKFRRTARTLLTVRLDLTLFVMGLVALGIALIRSR